MLKGYIVAMSRKKNPYPSREYVWYLSQCPTYFKTTNK